MICRLSSLLEQKRKKAERSPRQFSAVMKHMALAIFKGRFAKLRGDGVEGKFASAVEIAKARLGQTDHTASGKLTSKGRKVSKRHRSEDGGKKKTAEFDSLAARAKS